MSIGTLEIVIIDDARRYKIHLNKPDIEVLHHIKNDKKLNDLKPGCYIIKGDYTYECK